MFAVFGPCRRTFRVALNLRAFTKNITNRGSVIGYLCFVCFAYVFLHYGSSFVSLPALHSLRCPNYPLLLLTHFAMLSQSSVKALRYLDMIYCWNKYSLFLFQFRQFLAQKLGGCNQSFSLWSM